MFAVFLAAGVQALCVGNLAYIAVLSIRGRNNHVV